MIVKANTGFNWRVEMEGEGVPSSISINTNLSKQNIKLGLSLENINYKGVSIGKAIFSMENGASWTDPVALKQISLIEGAAKELFNLFRPAMEAACDKLVVDIKAE